jgi:hypothetical protein
MKQLLTFLFLISSFVSFGQFAPTSAKTKFVNGIGIGSKDTSQFTAADTIALTIARDSVMYYRYRGFWRPIATGGNLSAYKLISDTLFANGYTTRARLKQGLDSLAATKVNISDTASMLAPYFRDSDTTGLLNQVVRTFGAQTVFGIKAFGDSMRIGAGLSVLRIQADAGISLSQELNIRKNTNSLSTDFLKIGTSVGSGILYGSYIKSTSNHLSFTGNDMVLGVTNTSGNNVDAISISSAGVTSINSLSTAGIVTNTSAGVLGTTSIVPIANGGTGSSTQNFVDLTTSQTITGQKTFNVSGNSGNVIINHGSGSGVALNITKGGNGEGLIVNKTSGSGNAATITGTLEATTLVKNGGTSSQFLKADGSVDNNTYTTTSQNALKLNISDTAAMLLPYTRVQRFTDSLTNVQSRIQTKQNILTLTTTGTSGAATLVGSTLNIPQYQSVLTNPVTGTGTTNYLPKFTGSTTVGNSVLQEGTNAIGLGVTPSAWSGRPAIQIADDAYIVSNNGNIFFGTNTYFNGSARTYISTGAAAMYRQVSGQHRWETAVSGTANTSISFTQAMTLAANGNLLLGGTVDNGERLQVSGAIISTTEISARNGDIQMGFDATYSIPYMALGWGGRANANNKIYASRDATDGIIINAATGRGVLINTNGGATTALTIASSGNLGLGVTPSAWQTSSYRVIQLPNGASIHSQTDAPLIEVASNMFINSAYNYTYITNGFATRYRQNAGEHVWLTAPSGTAGNAISFTQAMTLDASGRLGVGTTSPSERLQVDGSNVMIKLNAATDTFAQLGYYENGTLKWNAYNNYVNDNYQIGNIAGTYFAITSTGNVGIGTTSPNTTLDVRGKVTAEANDAYYRIRNASAVDVGYITDAATWGDGVSTDFAIGASSTNLRFYTNNSVTERMRITSGGNLLLGTTTDNGARLQVSGNVNARLYIVNEASANRGGLYPYNTVAGSGTDYSVGIFSEGEIFLAAGGSATKRFTMSTTGAATFSSLAGTGDRLVQANSSGELSATQTIASGTYTPTITDNLNTSSYTVQHASYTRIGNICTVYMRVSFTASSSVCGINVTIPVGNNFSNSNQATGSNGNGANGLVMYNSTASASTNQIFTSMSGATVGSNTISFSFQYQVQ